MFDPHAKFEVSTITCNEDMKGNARYNKYSGVPKVNEQNGVMCYFTSYRREVNRCYSPII